MQRILIMVFTATAMVGIAPAQSDTCTSPDPIVGTGTFPYDTTLNSTSSLSFGGFPCVGSISQDAFFVWTAPSSGNYNFSWCTSTYDTRAQIHLGSDCSATCLAQNDDACALQTMIDLVGVVGGQQYLIQVGGFGAGHAGPATMTITSAGTSPGIQILCDPANPHHLGQSASLGNSYLSAATGSGLHLEATNGPPGEFGFALVSSVTMAPLSIFNGVLCLGAPQGRYNPLAASNQSTPGLSSLGQFDPAGILQNIAGTATSTGGSGFDVPTVLPYAGSPTITPGSVWYFQIWFRDQNLDPGDSANFTNMIEVTFP